MSRLIEFYRGEGRDSEGRSLAEIWAFSDAELESVHDFIQWIFPLREPSGFNPDAPRLSDLDVAAFRSDPILRANLLRSLDVFLAFLGLRRIGGRVAEGPDFDAKRGVFARPNHNWLRISRALRSLRTLGLEGEALAFFEFLRAYRDGGRSGITAGSFRHWSAAAPASPGNSSMADG